MSIVSSHKILGHYGGRFHFADVWIEVFPENAPRTVVEIGLQDIDGIDKVFEDWSQAALNGLNRFALNNRDVALGKRFIVRKILGMLVDTEDETIEIAAYLASYKAFIKEPLPQISYTNSWYIEPK